MASDTKVKNPLLLVGTKSQITAAGMGENDFGIATDVEFYTANEVDDKLANIDALPDQTGNTGKVLMTDGASASWQEAPSGGAKITIKRYS